MRGKRKILALLLALSMVLTFMPTMTFAISSTVAKIGDKEYESLREAIQDAQDYDTITMIADDRASFKADGKLVEIGINKEITIDGKGYTLYGISDSYDSYGQLDHDIYIYGTKDVTIKNLTISEFGDKVATQINIYPIWAGKSYSGTLTLDSVTINKFNRTALNLNGGKFVIKNCTFTGNTTPFSSIDYFQSGIGVLDATVTIENTNMTNMGAYSEPWPDSNEAGCIQLTGSGSIEVLSGSYSGDYCLISHEKSTGSLMVNGGSYNGQTSIIDNESNVKERVSVSGGTFNQKIPSNVTIATGKAEVKNTDGTFTVTSENEVAASIGDTNYTSVEAAVNDAQASDTVDLKPAAAGTTVTTDKDINIKNDTGSTVNLNGTVVASGETKNAKVAKAEADAAADLATAKKNAIDALNKVNLKSYAEPERSKVKAAIDSAKKKINAATTVAAVNSAKAAADKTIKAQAKYNSKLPKPTARFASGYKGYLRARWYKLSKKKRSKISGFEVQYSTDKNFRNYKIARAHKTNSVKTVYKVPRKKRFWVRSRVYTVNKNGVKTVGAWSKVRTLKTK